MQTTDRNEFVAEDGPPATESDGGDGYELWLDLGGSD